MILGLAKNADKSALPTRRAAPGLFVVVNAYAGSYEYFSESDPAVEQTCYDNGHGEAGVEASVTSERESGSDSDEH